MSTLSKRSLLGLTAVAALTALVGCGKKEEAAPARRGTRVGAGSRRRARRPSR